MPTIQQIEKAQNESKRLKKIVEVVIPTLSELYGAPNWMVKPKEDQNSSEILRQWADVLGGYSEHQLKRACLKFYKYNKSTGFPTLGKLSSELCEEDQEDYVAPRRTSEMSGFNIESWLMAQDGSRCIFIRPIYADLLKFVIHERLPYAIGFDECDRLTKLEREKGMQGVKFKTAWNNHLFSDREMILPMIQKRRNGENIELPLSFCEQPANSEDLGF